MRRRFAAAALTLCVILIGQMSALACGAKFLLSTRGTRFQQAPVARAAVGVLVYAPQRSDLSATLVRLSVDVRLRKAGYHPTIVETAPALDAALSLGGWDVIVVDGRDSAAIRARTDLGSAELLPVVSADDATHAAGKSLVGFMKSPAAADAFVKAIDTTVATCRLKPGRRSSQH